MSVDSPLGGSWPKKTSPFFTHRDVLMNAQSPHRWRSTLKSAVFGLSSSLPPLVGGGGGLVCESVSKADLLSDLFDGRPVYGQASLVRLEPLWGHRPIVYVFSFS